MLLVTRNKFTHKNHLLLLLSEGDIKIACMYERVNINCAEVNSTRQMGSGIYFFISVSADFFIKDLQFSAVCIILKQRQKEHVFYFE